MKRSMKRSKKFLALTLLLSVLVTAGCGNAGEQKAAAATEAAQEKDLENIGAGAGESREQDASEEGFGTETEEEKKAADFSFIEGWITSIEEDKTEFTLIIAHHIKEPKSVEFTYQDVLLDGVAAENWEAQGRGQSTFTIDPNNFQSFPQTLVLGANIDHYSELTIHATANFEDGTEPYPFSATFQVSELDRKIKEKVAAVSDEILIEEQEIYNADGILVTVPAQTVSDKDGFSIHVENNTDDSMVFYYENVTVNGVLTKEMRTSSSDMTVPGQGLDMYVTFIYPDEEYKEKMQPDVKSGEIGFTLGDAGLEKEFLLTLKYTRNN